MLGTTKTKEEIIYELLLSLNKGNTGYVGDRVEYALEQYRDLERYYKTCKNLDRRDSNV